MWSRSRIAALVAACSCAAVVGACGGDDGGGGSSSGSKSTGATKGAKTIKANAMDNAKGSVTYCAGKDTSGDLKEGVKEFNKQFKSKGLSAKLQEFPESADEQRNQFIQRERAKSAECDGFESDVVWTAEFANQKWLTDTTDYVNSRKDEFIPSTLNTIQYDGKYFGVPRVTDSGFIYYRKDVIKKEPKTWQELYDMAKKANPQGIVYQGASYEGLTVDFLELAFAAGGKVLSDDGKKSEINSKENLEALKFMVDGIKQGAAPKAVTTYMEEQARRTFEAGKASFERQWPYAYALAKAAPKIKDKFAIMPYPSWEGGGKAAVLGGHNMIISAYSDNPGGTLKFIDYMTSAERMKRNAVKYSKSPVLKATYQDASVQKALPFWKELEDGVTNGKPRPVSPVYSLISEAIYKNVNAALSGGTSPEKALKDADAQITKALSTF